jgi:predicted membrane-bound mannosyltransferase
MTVVFQKKKPALCWVWCWAGAAAIVGLGKSKVFMCL